MEAVISQLQSLAHYAPDLVGLVFAGLLAGFIAGLFGVGGGTITVPILFYWFTHMGVSQDHAMHAAVGTSLATIIATSYASASAHEKRGSVDHAILKGWAPYIAAGSILGSVLAGFFSGVALRGLFGGFLLFVAFYMLLAKEGKSLFPALPTGLGRALSAGGIGTLSSLVGIGGGAIAVPLMSLCNVPMQRAVGTSSAFGLIIAIPGTLGFIASGWGKEGLPPLSLGYICLAALIILLPATAFMAPWGAKLAHKLSRALLRRVFAVFLCFIAIKMLWGLFAP